MSVEIVRPFLLALIPVIIGVLVYSSRYMGRQQKGKVSNIVVLRSVIFLLVILALCGISVRWSSKNTTTIFVVDLSDSVRDFRSEAEKFVREAINQMPPHNKTGIITFGGNSQVEQFVTDKKSFDRILTRPVQNATNIEDAVTSALSLMNQDSAKRIVLITDGEENDGSVEALIPSIREQRVDLKVYKIENAVKDEVYVSNLTIPDKINIGDSFNVNVDISSNVATSARVSLFSGRVKKGEVSVDLQKGNNRFVFKDTQTETGLKSYKVIVEADNDTEVKNNEYSAFTQIQSRPRVLVIEGKPGEADDFSRMLEVANISFTKIMSNGAPETISEMSEYKAIIAVNVHRDDLNKGFMDNIETYVKDYAGGFIATGGEDSFALGQYRDTPLEKVLPVYMDMKGKKEIPEMSLVMVIDHSGSMLSGNQYINKLDLAKESAIKALDTLRVNDNIGVLAFTDVFDWVVKLTKASDKVSIEDKIAGISLGGGTSIYPALDEAYKKLLDSNSKIKHIILLTDGQDGFREYDELIKKMNEANMTLSTVSVGEDADKYILNLLATNGKGRYYHTDINTDIPRIFAKEVFLSVRSYLNNREFVPVLTNLHPIISNVLNGNQIPSLLGYIGTSPKETATVILESDAEDPILTVWQYGLGKAVAWTSDVSGEWNGNYINWENNIQLWQNIINWTISDITESGNYASITQGAKNVLIEYSTKDYSENLAVKAVYTTETGKQGEVMLDPVMPGKYEGSIDFDELGVYVINIREEEKGEVKGFLNTAAVMQYSPEYRFNSNKDLLETLVNELSGKFIKFEDEVFKGELKTVSGRMKLTDILLFIASILFLYDIAYRRLNIKYKKPIRKKEKDKVIVNRDSVKNISVDVVDDKKIETIVKNEKTEKVNKSSKKQTKESINTSSLLQKKKDRL